MSEDGGSQTPGRQRLTAGVGSSGARDCFKPTPKRTGPAMTEAGHPVLLSGPDGGPEVYLRARTAPRQPPRTALPSINR